MKTDKKNRASNIYRASLKVIRGGGKRGKPAQGPAKLVIGAPSPENFKHKDHVVVDERSSTGFRGLPQEWKDILRANNIGKDRVLANNEEVLAALQFYTGGQKNKNFPLLTAKELKKTMANTATIVERNPEHLYKKIEKIGEGAGGVVYKIMEKKTNQILAVKISPKEELSYIQSEIAFHAMSKHENIVNYHATMLWRDDVWIVMDFIDGGCLTDILGEDNPAEWTENCIAYVMRDSLLALDFMHKKHLLHRDIKSDNILVGRDGTVKLADFGFAIGLTAEQEKRKSTVGTPFWMAPEVIEGREYDARCDIWSLGITAIELVNHEPPHMDKKTVEALLDILTFPPPTPNNPDIRSASFLDFLDQSMKKDFKERPFAHELLEHDFLKKACTKAEFAAWVNHVLDEKAKMYDSDI
uniref:Non-specific serine/threonine protein kinase n=1 Tax=Aplanochytrium stocchinoi TaxID=215587 RepID=A0A7S3PR12_9STRA|mmetsp:Transcript_14031/g.17391  ORF Transcript_14031/g.17391 Transcript_14031/m.17391 type:complete len:413 (-) Transcript_14031:1269-2507(-)